MGPLRTPKGRYYQTPPRTPYNVARRLFTTGVKYAARVAYKKATAPKSQVATTTQHDVARQYRYKRMPRNKRRRWVKALRQNTALDMAGSATQTVVLNSTVAGNIDYVGGAGKTQNWVCMHLYGMNGVPYGAPSEVGEKDIKFIKDNDLRLKTQVNSHVKFMSGIMDLTVKNPNTANGLEVDIYEVVYNTATKRPSMSQLHLDLFSTTVSNRNPANPADTPGWDKRGMTPFDTVQFGSFGAKIISKKKVQLPPGNTFTYQYRDPKNHYFGPDAFDDTTGFVKPYVTRSILILYKTIAGETISGTDPGIIVGCTRVYKYKVKGEADAGLIYA